jgi:uncharacterized protein involved in exopolysaccharide biosynthesis
VSSDAEATAPQSRERHDPGLVENQRWRIAELEELVAELPDLRRRLIEAEQRLAELPELRRRSERLDEIESSPTLRLVNRARQRGRLRAASRVRALRVAAKRALGVLARRIAGD